MAHLRFNALDIVSKRTTDRIEAPSNKISDYFAQDVFTLDQMKATLAPDVFKKVSSAIDKGKK